MTLTEAAWAVVNTAADYDRADWPDDATALDRYAGSLAGPIQQLTEALAREPAPADDGPVPPLALTEADARNIGRGTTVCEGCRKGHYALGGTVTNYPCAASDCGCWFCHGPQVTPAQAHAAAGAAPSRPEPLAEAKPCGRCGLPSDGEPLSRTPRRLVAEIVGHPAVGDRVVDGGEPGVLVWCRECGGDGVLHQRDTEPGTVVHVVPAPEDDRG